MANASLGGCRASAGTQATHRGPLRTRQPLLRSRAKVDWSRTRHSTCGLAWAGSSDVASTWIRDGSGRQSLAALVTSSFEHGAARPRGHPVAEPVALGALAVVGLEWSLHLASCGLWGRRARSNRRDGAYLHATGLVAGRERDASATLEPRADFFHLGRRRRRRAVLPSHVSPSCQHCSTPPFPRHPSMRGRCGSHISTACGRHCGRTRCRGGRRAGD